MTSTSSDMSRTERDVLLAKRLFLGGLLALPWLWAANVLYFLKKLRAGEAGKDLTCLWLVAILVWVGVYQGSVRETSPELAVYTPPQYWFWEELPWKWTSGIRSDISTPEGV